MGILDQDVDDKVSLAVPQLYKTGIEQKEWTRTKFWYVNLLFSHLLLVSKTSNRVYTGFTCWMDCISL